MVSTRWELKSSKLRPEAGQPVASSRGGALAFGLPPSPARGLDGTALADYRAYSLGVVSDIDAAARGRLPGMAREHTYSCTDPSLQPPDDPRPAATLTPGGPEENYSLADPPYEHTTPRYSASRVFQDRALAAVEAECGGIFWTRGREAQAAILGMAARLLQIQDDQAGCGTHLQLCGMSAFQMFCREFAGNPRVSDEMLLRIGNVELKDMARSPEEREDIERRVPGSRQLLSHKMAVALLSALTGIPPEILSRQCPDLGLSGTPEVGLWEPGTGYPEEWFGEQEDFQVGNILHDTTDFLKDAGVGGLNQAVWGCESSTESAAVSVREAYDGGRYS